jgi:hypothetical protein
MKKAFTCVGIMLFLVTVFAITPAAAAPKIAGEWALAITHIEPDGTIGNNAMEMTLYATANPTLFYGVLHLGDPDPQYITIMMDSGANMHFAISFMGPGEIEIRTHTSGRGTASTSKIVGSWSDDIGLSGNFTATRK